MNRQTYHGGAPFIKGPYGFNVTPLGGFTVSLINTTGEVSVYGKVVRASRTVDMGAELVIDGVPDPIGAIYTAGVPIGGIMRVVTSGIAEVLVIGAFVRGYLCRTFLAAEAGYIPGYALSELFPAPPFASDKHFCEFGHIMSSGTGLAKVNIHCN